MSPTVILALLELLTDYFRLDFVLLQVGTPPSSPRTCGRQTHRNNVPAASPLDYFRKSITYPLLDELDGQFTTRFSHHQQVASRGLSLLPSSIRQQPSSVDEAMEFCREHEDDLPVDQSLATLEAELSRWALLISKLPESEVPANIPDALVLARKSLFPCITRLLQLVATWPATSNSCERSISALRRLKTYLRSTMLQQRLCGLALLHTHYCHAVDPESIIKRFLALRPRAIVAPGLMDEEVAADSHNESDSDMD